MFATRYLSIILLLLLDKISPILEEPQVFCLILQKLSRTALSKSRALALVKYMRKLKFYYQHFKSLSVLCVMRILSLFYT